MDVVVGPVSARSMAAFASFARATLEGVGPGSGVPSDAARCFFDYIAQWDALAVRGGEVTWNAEADAEVVEYLVYAFWRVAKEVSEDATGTVVVVPAKAVAFYRQLVGGLLSAMETAGGSHAEFAADLREFWPGEHDIP